MASWCSFCHTKADLTCRLLTIWLLLLSMQIWVSPWQVAHVLSILEVLKQDLPSGAAKGGAQASSGPAAGTGTSAMRMQLRIRFSLEIPLISAMCLVRALQPILINLS